MVTRALITGGAGFFGFHLANHLRRDAVHVRLFDIAACPRWAPVQGIQYVRGDVRDTAALGGALAGCDVVVHAAFASPRQSLSEIRSVNVRGTWNVCAQAAAQGVRRVVIVSSTIVLNPPRPHPVFQNSPLTRLDRYRESRAEAESRAAEWAANGPSIAIVRPKTLLGPERVGAFAILFELIRLGRVVPVLGSGHNRYQLLDVRDLAEGLRLLSAGDARGVFAFGARDFGSVREDLQSLLDHAHTGARLRFLPSPLARTGLRWWELLNLDPLSEWHSMSAWGRDSIVDISRAERELGWRPARSNAQALADAYDWYLAGVRATGSVPSTHKVPFAHRALRRLAWILRA